ncbi:hypothetical protein [Halothiobacillus sp.]|jgi:hypothetical protein|uniref:hypothetical protein n=1 Tax=Halothiobacillus sp. TaxID=1891311 RepID=UPI00261E4322|nr:hypothetical protein [Halothiobacillus sp.]MDD3576334.1 hypothetical protein [Halothiobacillus sp.]MDY0147572.1 hypothetical protein [Halothiobacillus sp.]
MNQKTYVGIYNDEQGGMTHIAKVIRDAWVFDLIPETETCEGWLPAQIQVLYEKVYAAWEPYAHLPSRLPPELQAKFMRINEEAIARGRSQGWDPELGDDD